jgi:hypothetical protein
MYSAEKQKEYRHRKGISKKYYFLPKVDKIEDVIEYEKRRKRCDMSNAKWFNKKSENEKREYRRIISKNHRDAIKHKVFSHYGYKCACCGETIKQFLCIDHINGNGNAHRKEIGHVHIYKWLVLHGFPKGFQTLCHNCNQGKSMNGGICPHKSCKTESKNDDMREVQEQDMP